MSDISREQALAHFGVKGMRWGVRNETTRSSTEPKNKMSTKKKVAIGVGVVAVGTAVTLAVLGKHGKLPIKEVSNLIPSRSPSPELWNQATRHADTGAKKVKRLSDSGAMEVKFKKILAEFDADIAKAHKAETDWMRKADPLYNPRTDPYIPAYELQRLRTG